jgi:hypothetical protein
MAKANELNWQRYESITKYIYETLGNEPGVKIEGWGRYCKVRGKSGTDHQIDVLTSQSDGTRKYKTAIECKYWNKKIDKVIVMKLAEIIEDADIEKGIIVAKSGFTRDGQIFAKHKNIELIELREANEKDLKGNAKEIPFAELDLHLHLHKKGPTISKIDIGNNRVISIEDEFDYFKFLVQKQNREIVTLYQYVHSFIEEINLHNKKSETITKRYEIPNGILIDQQTDESFQIDEITFTGQLSESNESKELNFQLVDKVWLIMKSIFENRTFTCLENGIIIEHKKE